MPLGTLDGTPPPFFRQGPSALSKLTFCSVLALFLMVADARFSLVQPLRVVLATVLYPVQWLALRPVVWSQESSKYLESRSTSQSNEEATQRKLDLQSLRANQVEQLSLENARLRQLLGLRERVTTPSLTAQVLYDAADPYTRKVIIDKGQIQGVDLGSPVLDESGVLGQVTRVHPLVSEVTLLIDGQLSIPVLNVRSGARSVAYGDPGAGSSGLELRFMGGNADVQPGDLLTTSGVDGVYPSGLPVAKIRRIERRSESAFLKIDCQPLALVTGAQHVIVVKPVLAQIPLRPTPEVPPVRGKKGVAP